MAASATTAIQSGHTLNDWRPDDDAFWNESGRSIAKRNLWISIPCLLLAFSVWMVWSVVVAKLPAIGFEYSTDQLFWLAALPGLSGATLRIFYSFMVPIFGGRLWTSLSTASLLLPALGVGYAVQNPGHFLRFFPVTRPVMRIWRRQLRVLHGQHRFLLSQEGEGECPGTQCWSRQSRRFGHAVRGSSGNYRRGVWSHWR